MSSKIIFRVRKLDFRSKYQGIWRETI